MLNHNLSQTIPNQSIFSHLFVKIYRCLWPLLEEACSHGKAIVRNHLSRLRQ